MFDQLIKNARKIALARAIARKKADAREKEDALKKALKKVNGLDDGSTSPLKSPKDSKVGGLHLENFRRFCVVAEAEGDITLAAKNFQDISKNHLISSIPSLERILKENVEKIEESFGDGVKLIEPTGNSRNKVALTDEGKALHRALSKFDSALNTIGKDSETIHVIPDELKIVCDQEWFYDLEWIPRHKAVKEKFPNTSFKVEPDEAKKLIEKLGNGGADIGIMSFCDPGVGSMRKPTPIFDLAEKFGVSVPEGFVEIPLSATRFIVLSNPNFSFGSRETAGVDGTEELLKDYDPTMPTFKEEASKLGMSLGPIRHFTRLSSLISGLTHGKFGAAILPEGSTHNPMIDKFVELAVVDHRHLPSLAALDRNNAIVWNKGFARSKAYLPKAAKQLQEALKTPLQKSQVDSNS